MKRRKPKLQKSFSQEELDAAIGKRLARERRKWEREAQAPVPRPTDLPLVEDFENAEEYAEKLADYTADQKLRQMEVSAPHRRNSTKAMRNAKRRRGSNMTRL